MTRWYAPGSAPRPGVRMGHMSVAGADGTMAAFDRLGVRAAAC